MIPFLKNINAKNIVALMTAALKGILSPTEKIERRKLRRQARYARRWSKHASYVHCGKRQQARYARNKMDEQQRNSHKPGTVQPYHIFCVDKVVGV